jgi:hypothetical protein
VHASASFHSRAVKGRSNMQDRSAESFRIKWADPPTALLHELTADSKSALAHYYEANVNGVA